MGVAFNVQNSQLLTLSIPTEEIFQVRGKKSADLPTVDFRSQQPSKNVTAYKLYGFFSVLATIIRENSDKWIENGKGFAVHSST